MPSLFLYLDIVPQTAPEIGGDLASIRESVVRDLLPILDKTDSTPEEKFDIYKDALKTMHDAKTIEGAYKTATQIADESKKAEALIGLMKAIDNAQNKKAPFAGAFLMVKFLVVETILC